jgi:hypothetical protein
VRQAGCLPEVGTLLLKALEAALPEMPSPESEHFESRDVSAETSVPRVPIGVRRADALGVMAESFLKHGIESLSGGDRHQIIVHVDADTLADCCEGRCEIEEGPSMAAETARRLACDSSVIPLIENDQGEPLNVGRTTRTISPALRRLLNARDKGCRFPGCTHTRFVDAHHIEHWADGGETKPSNLVTLCRHHHRCVHEGGFQIHVLDDGAWRFLRPDGRCVDSVVPGYTQPLGDWEYLPANNRERGVSIDARTAATRWAGETMDYGLAVEVSMQRVARRKQATAAAEAVSSDRLPTTPGVGSGLQRPAWTDCSWKVSAETREDDGVWWSSEWARGGERVQSLEDR